MSFSLLQKLTPEAPKDKAYRDLVTVLKAHFEPKLLVIAERFNFYQHRQQQGKSIANFIMDLQRLTANCEFGDILHGQSAQG